MCVVCGVVVCGVVCGVWCVVCDVWCVVYVIYVWLVLSLFKGIFPSYGGPCKATLALKRCYIDAMKYPRLDSRLLYQFGAQSINS